MATKEMIIQLSDTDRELIRRLTDALEGARPPRSNSVQPLVGPPDVNQGEPAALARPATIAEVMSVLQRWLMVISSDCVPLHSKWLFNNHCKKMFQALGTLDQGPGTKPPPEISKWKPWESDDSE